MDMESLYDYVEEDQDFYEETPATRKGGYPIDHRFRKVSRSIIVRLNRGNSTYVFSRILLF